MFDRQGSKKGESLVCTLLIFHCAANDDIVISVSPVRRRAVQKAQNTLSDNQKKHILIFGYPNSGKTSLGVSIATEYTIKKRIGFYTTAMKTAILFQNSDSELQKTYNLDWSWRDADILVIDDIDIGGNNPDVITPDFFHAIQEQSLYKTKNLSALQTKTVIWIVGNSSTKTQWLNYLHNIEIPNENIVSIHLQE